MREYVPGYLREYVRRHLPEYVPGYLREYVRQHLQYVRQHLRVWTNRGSHV
jgi:hypothetical protein